MTAGLTSWTRTLNERDAMDLLDAALPGRPLAEWEAGAHERLPQSSPARRRELIKIVREDLLDHADGHVVDAAFGRLFHEGSPHRRLGLLYGRLSLSRPLMRPALEQLVLPALAAADAPLAPDDADLVQAEAWDAFLRDVLKPGTGDEAFTKTRSTLQTALARCGVLDIAGNQRRVTRVRHGEPDALAFAWLVATELARGVSTEASEAWAIESSFAARLFATRRDYAAACVDAGVSAGLLSRGLLAGAPRLHVGAL